MVVTYLYRSLLAAGVIVLSFSAAAEPQQVECKDLIRAARNGGTVPKVTIDPNWGIVRIVAAERYCREPREIWNNRGLSWPTEMTPDAEAPQSFLNQNKTKVRAPEVKKAAPVEPKPAPVVAEPAPVEPEPAPTPEVVAPEIVAPEPIVNPYAAGTERPSIISKRPSIISGQVIMPQSTDAGEGATKPLNLADAVRSRMQLGAPEPEVTPKVEEPTNDGFMSLGLWIALAGVGLGLGGGVFFFYRRASQAGEKEDGEEDEEDEELTS